MSKDNVPSGPCKWVREEQTESGVLWVYFRPAKVDNRNKHTYFMVSKSKAILGCGHGAADLKNLKIPGGKLMFPVKDAEQREAFETRERLKAVVVQAKAHGESFDESPRQGLVAKFEGILTKGDPDEIAKWCRMIEGFAESFKAESKKLEKKESKTSLPAVIESLATWPAVLPPKRADILRAYNDANGTKHKLDWLSKSMGRLGLGWFPGNPGK